MQCYDRDNESTNFWRQFKKGKNVLMLAPRRVGKTVFINRLKEESESHGFHAIVIDVEGYRDEKAFFRQMCAAIQEEIGVGQAVIAAFVDRLKRVVYGNETNDDWRTILLNTDWKVFIDHLLSQLTAQKDGLPWLFLIDEIPIFTRALLESEGLDRTHDFLYTLRNLRQKYAKVRWLYTGSIGLDTIARRNGIEGALVDMEVESLEPFDRQTAAGFLDFIAKSNSRTFDDAAIERIISRLGWLSPYYLEKIGETACDNASEKQPIDLNAADAAVNSLLELSRRTYWATWREHLDKNFVEPERAGLFTLLGVIARSAEGVSIGTLLSALNKGGEATGETELRNYLDTLEADGYLSADNDRVHYRFRMNLLREWWLRYVAPKLFSERSHG